MRSIKKPEFNIALEWPAGKDFLSINHPSYFYLEELAENKFAKPPATQEWITPQGQSILSYKF